MNIYVSRNGSRPRRRESKKKKNHEPNRVMRSLGTIVHVGPSFTYRRARNSFPAAPAQHNNNETFAGPQHKRIFRVLRRRTAVRSAAGQCNLRSPTLPYAATRSRRYHIKRCENTRIYYIDTIP